MTMTLFLSSDFTHFLGRFHPVLVHLPIGFLLLAILMEWYQRIKARKIGQLIGYAWLLGSLGGMASIISGWWLSDTGLYLEDDLFFHRWLGVSLVIMGFIGWWLKTNRKRFSTGIQHTINILVLLVICIEGHLGGTLTHGPDYLLEYAPDFLKNKLVQKEEFGKIDYSNQDSILVYKDLIEPIFQEKCWACHSSKVQRGLLNMEHPDSLLQGGENGSIIIAGNTAESELFKRITLSPKSQKYMPPVGEPLTYSEIQLLDWWIANGADFTMKIDERITTGPIKSILSKNYGIDTTPKPWYETVKMNPVDSLVIEKLINQGFSVKKLGEANHLLDIKYNDETLNEEKIKSLVDVSEHITWLSFAKSNISDSHLNYISQFPNLTRLQLEKTQLTDAGIKQLSSLEHLESINLYETRVSEKCLEDLTKISSLRRIYLWNTSVDKTLAQEIISNNPEMEIIF